MTNETEDLNGPKDQKPEVKTAESTLSKNSKRLKTATSAVGKARETAEGVSKIAESANNAISAVKWVAIAVVLGLVLFTGYTGYKIISAPAKAVGSAVESVSDTVKSNASSIKEGTAEFLNRFNIETTDPDRLNTLAEAAFKAVSNMEPVVPETMKSRVYLKANFPGHENKVCRVNVPFETVEIPVWVAADNKDHATAKSLGSRNHRMMRFVIRVEGNDISLNTRWDEENRMWTMQWKRSTLSKPLTDTEAQSRMFTTLQFVANTCR